MSDIREKWLVLLAKLVTPHDPVRAAEAMLVYLPWLMPLPPEAFCRASLEAVALAERRLMIPDLAEVLHPLRKWWAENKPPAARLVLPSAPEPRRVSEEERAAVAEQMAALRAELSTKLRAPEAAPRAAIRAHPAAPIELAEARRALAERARKTG